MSVAIAAGRNHFALHRLSRVLVKQNDGLVGSNLRIERNHAAKLADGVRMGANNEFFAVQRLAIDTERHR